MSTNTGGLPDQKYSVYVALGIAGTMSMVDLVYNGSLDASKEITLALIGFAAARQVMKSLLKK